MAVADTKRRVSITLPLDALHELDRYAFEHGVTKSVVTTIAINDFLAKQREDHDGNQKDAEH